MMKQVPKLNWPYWTALTLASVFGANAGDYLAVGLGLGHVRGIPFLAVCLIVTFLAERTSKRGSAIYYWIAIIIIRAAATNVGDIFHDLRISFPYSVPGVCLVFVGLLTLRARTRKPGSAAPAISADGFYWVAMFMAGVVGTVGGDAMSFGLRLGPLGAAVTLGGPVLILLAVGNRKLINQLFYYWITIALVRSAGTAAGDFLAHKILTLPVSTAVTGLVFISTIVVAYGASASNSILLARRASQESA